jgi:hypothetical protein
MSLKAAKPHGNAVHEASGVRVGELAAYPHLKKSIHFGAKAAVDNPALKKPRGRDGLQTIGKMLGKALIGG